MDGVTRATVMGKLCFPRFDWYLLPSYLSNHKSWEVDAVKAKLNLGSMRFGKNAAELRRDGKDPGRRVDVYPTVLVRPVCGGCGKPMALNRSNGKYKSFVCLNSIHGGHGCRNKGNKSARIIDEAVLKAEGLGYERLAEDKTYKVILARKP
jgi:hypothetical protein